MTTTGERLVTLSELPGVETAMTHYLAITTGGGPGGTIFVDGVEVKVEPDIIATIEPEAVAVKLEDQIDVLVHDWLPTPIGLTYLIRDEFTTDQAAPLDVSRDCEPGPGVMNKVEDIDDHAYVADGELVFSIVVGEGQLEYSFTPQFNDVAGVAIAGRYQKPASDWGWVGYGSPTAPSRPIIYCHAGTWKVYDTNLAIIEVGTYDADTLYRWMFIPRSDQNTGGGYHVVIDGRLAWVIRGGVTFDSLRTIFLRASYTGTTWQNANSEITRIDLPANGYPDWNADFSKVTYLASPPPPNTAFDCDADFSLELTFTYDIGQILQCRPRYTDTQNYIEFYIKVDGWIRLDKLIDGERSILYSADAFSDGVSYKVAMTGVDADVELFIDGVLKTSQVISDVPMVDGGFIYDGLTTGDLVLKTNPNPALGIATDRIIHPQTDDLGTHAADCRIDIRDIQLPTVGNINQYFRWQDDTHNIWLTIGTGGDIALFDYNGGSTLKISALAGTVSSGDDIALVLDDETVELFVVDTLVGSATISNWKTLTTYKAKDIKTDLGGSIGSVEFWRLYVAAISPPELV